MHAGLLERADLVVHQRDQRADDDRDAAAGAVAHDRRHLVAQALAAAGGHQHQRVAAADRRARRSRPARRGTRRSRTPRARTSAGGGGGARRRAGSRRSWRRHCTRARGRGRIRPFEGAPQCARGARPARRSRRIICANPLRQQERAMASVNKVIIIGNLGRDPEVRYTPNGSAVCNVSVATTRNWKNKDSGEQGRRDRVAPRRLLRPPGRDRRRVPEEGPLGLRRRAA